MRALNKEGVLWRLLKRRMCQQIQLCLLYTQCGILLLAISIASGIAAFSRGYNYVEVWLYNSGYAMLSLSCLYVAVNLRCCFISHSYWLGNVLHLESWRNCRGLLCEPAVEGAKLFFKIWKLLLETKDSYQEKICCLGRQQDTLFSSNFRETKNDIPFSNNDGSHLSRAANNGFTGQNNQTNTRSIANWRFDGSLNNDASMCHLDLDRTKEGIISTVCNKKPFTGSYDIMHKSSVDFEPQALMYNILRKDAHNEFNDSSSIDVSKCCTNGKNKSFPSYSESAPIFLGLCLFVTVSTMGCWLLSLLSYIFSPMPFGTFEILYICAIGFFTEWKILTRRQNVVKFDRIVSVRCNKYDTLMNAIRSAFVCLIIVVPLYICLATVSFILSLYNCDNKISVLLNFFVLPIFFFTSDSSYSCSYRMTSVFVASVWVIFISEYYTSLINGAVDALNGDILGSVTFYPRSGFLLYEDECVFARAMWLYISNIDLDYDKENNKWFLSTVNSVRNSLLPSCLLSEHWFGLHEHQPMEKKGRLQSSTDVLQYRQGNGGVKTYRNTCGISCDSANIVPALNCFGHSAQSLGRHKCDWSSNYCYNNMRSCPVANQSDCQSRRTNINYLSNRMNYLLNRWLGEPEDSVAAALLKVAASCGLKNDCLSELVPLSSSLAAHKNSAIQDACFILNRNISYDYRLLDLYCNSAVEIWRFLLEVSFNIMKEQIDSKVQFPEGKSVYQIANFSKLRRPIKNLHTVKVATGIIASNDPSFQFRCRLYHEVAIDMIVLSAVYLQGVTEWLCLANALYIFNKSVEDAVRTTVITVIELLHSISQLSELTNVHFIHPLLLAHCLYFEDVANACLSRLVVYRAYIMQMPITFSRSVRKIVENLYG